MNVIKKIFFEGYIPGYIYMLKYGGYLGLLGLGVLYDTNTHKHFGEKAWTLFIIIMLISPLAILFPKIKIFAKIKGLRKPLGIIAGGFMLAHIVGYFLKYRGIYSPIDMLSDSGFWKINSMLLWGTLGGIVGFLLLITSNEYSVKLLKHHWKTLHRGAHLLFIFTILHIIFLKGDFSTILIFVIYLVLHIGVLIKGPPSTQ